MVSEQGAISMPVKVVVRTEHNTALNALDEQHLLIGTRAAFPTMSKANVKKRPAQTEHAALGAKKKIKTADVSSDCTY